MMKKDPLYKILKKNESTGLLCNQAGWHSSTGTLEQEEKTG
jgi:hypothetical protein